MSKDSWRRPIDAIRESLAEGWDRLRRSASDALTRFMPGDATRLPERADIDDAQYLPSPAWSMLGGDVFEDDRRVVVRIEAPGLERQDFDIEVLPDRLVVRGEKRFERESTEGRWRVLQCAYGSFHRSVPLSTPVRSDEARASYRNGVLRIELPKQAPGRPRARTIPVH